MAGCLLHHLAHCFRTASQQPCLHHTRWVSKSTLQNLISLSVLDFIGVQLDSRTAMVSLLFRRTKDDYCTHSHFHFYQSNVTRNVHVFLGCCFLPPQQQSPNSLVSHAPVTVVVPLCLQTGKEEPSSQSLPSLTHPTHCEMVDFLCPHLQRSSICSHPSHPSL